MPIRNAWSTSAGCVPASRVRSSVASSSTSGCDSSSGSSRPSGDRARRSSWPANGRPSRPTTRPRRWAWRSSWPRPRSRGVRASRSLSLSSAGRGDAMASRRCRVLREARGSPIASIDWPGRNPESTTIVSFLAPIQPACAEGGAATAVRPILATAAEVRRAGGQVPGGGGGAHGPGPARGRQARADAAPTQEGGHHHRTGRPGLDAVEARGRGQAGAGVLR